MTDNFLNDIYELPGFSGFVDCYDSIAATFAIVRESGKWIEISVRKGLPDSYSVSQIQLKYDHPFWEEFYRYIVESVKDHVPNMFKDTYLTYKD